MFSYVDKKIREKLIKDKWLKTLDREGKVINGSQGPRPYISILGPIPLPRTIDGRDVELSWYPFVRRLELRGVLDAANEVAGGETEAFRELIQANMSVNSVLALPGFLEKENPLVRIHSCCLTGDVFGSKRCECGPQLESAFSLLASDNGGAVIYMSGHEGRGIGLWAKAVTYLLQDDGQDTYEANVSLGLPEDSRDFSDAAVVLRFLLGPKPIRLLSNNPLKKEHLEQNGQIVSEMVSHVAGVDEKNKRYLKSKQKKGHILPNL